MLAYEIAERVFLDKYAIMSGSKNKKDGPLVVGKKKIKGKCAALHKNYSYEAVNIPRYAHKYKFFFVVFSKSPTGRSNKDDDIYVYEMKDIKRATGRTFGHIALKSLPLSMDMDSFAKLAK